MATREISPKCPNARRRCTICFICSGMSPAGIVRRPPTRSSFSSHSLTSWALSPRAISASSRHDTGTPGSAGSDIASRNSWHCRSSLVSHSIENGPEVAFDALTLRGLSTDPLNKLPNKGRRLWPTGGDDRNLTVSTARFDKPACRACAHWSLRYSNELEA